MFKERFYPKRNNNFQNPEKETERQNAKNIEYVETENGRFRIIYNPHGLEKEPKEIGEPEGVVIETGAYPYSNDQQAKDTLKELGNRPDYEKVFKYIKNEELPVYFVDINIDEIRRALANFLRIAESGVAITLIKSLAKEMKERLKREEQTMSRRDFLKLGIKASTGVFLGSELLAFLTRMESSFSKPNEESNKREIERIIMEVEQGTHPEINQLIFTLRDLIWAQKLETIAKKTQEEKGTEEKIELSMFVGHGHINLSNMLKKDIKERIKAIDPLLDKWGVKKERRRIADILKATPQEDGSWKLERFDDPELKEISNTRKR